MLGRADRRHSLCWRLVGLAALYVLDHALAGGAAALCRRAPPDLANGETMFNAGGCASCHATPKQDDKRRLGGGLALATQFGTFKVPNISLRPAASASVPGPRSSSSTPCCAGSVATASTSTRRFPTPPTSAWRSTTCATCSHSSRPCRRSLRPPSRTALPFPFNVRLGLGLWKLLYLDGKRFAPDPAKSAELNRGAYLVEGPGHCAECHSPRDLLGGIIADTPLCRWRGCRGQGLGAQHHAACRRHRQWSANDIAFLLESGFDPDGDSVGSTMADVVSQHRQAFSRRPRRHGGLPQVAAAAPRQGAAEEVTACGDRALSQCGSGSLEPEAFFCPIAGAVI